MKGVRRASHVVVWCQSCYLIGKVDAEETVDSVRQLNHADLPFLPAAVLNRFFL